MMNTEFIVEWDVENDECESEVQPLSGIYEKFIGKGKFPAVTQTIPGNGGTLLPVYLP